MKATCNFSESRCRKVLHTRSDRNSKRGDQSGIFNSKIRWGASEQIGMNCDLLICCRARSFLTASRCKLSCKRCCTVENMHDLNLPPFFSTPQLCCFGWGNNTWRVAISSRYLPNTTILKTAAEQLRLRSRDLGSGICCSSRSSVLIRCGSQRRCGVQ